jgi:hypothetical protein
MVRSESGAPETWFQVNESTAEFFQDDKGIDTGFDEGPEVLRYPFHHIIKELLVWSTRRIDIQCCNVCLS